VFSLMKDQFKLRMTLVDLRDPRPSVAETVVLIVGCGLMAIGIYRLFNLDVRVTIAIAKCLFSFMLAVVLGVVVAVGDDWMSVMAVFLSVALLCFLPSFDVALGAALMCFILTLKLEALSQRSYPPTLNRE